jgi:FixJ family two-component response regulator
MEQMKQLSTRIVLAVDQDEATHRALARLGECHGFLAGGFLSFQDFAEWFDDQCTYPTISNFVCCMVLDVGMLPSLEERAVPSVIYDIPKLYIGNPHFSCELNDLAGMGFFAFLPKPFTLQALNGRLHDAFIHHEKLLGGAQQVGELFARLSRREAEVGGWVVQGMTNLEIAAKLCISIKTVKAHRAQVMKKTESETIVDLIRFFDSHASLSGHKPVAR